MILLQRSSTSQENPTNASSDPQIAWVQHKAERGRETAEIDLNPIGQPTTTARVSVQPWNDIILWISLRQNTIHISTLRFYVGDRFQ